MLTTLEEEMDFIAARAVLENLEEMEIANENPRRYYQHYDPFHVSNKDFEKNFRLSKEVARFVINMLTPYVFAPTRRSALPIESKVKLYLSMFFFCYSFTICYSKSLRHGINHRINKKHSYYKLNTYLLLLYTIAYFRY